MPSEEDICMNLAKALMAYVALLKVPHEPQTGNKLYTFEELGKMMGKSKGTIRQWACAGEFGELVKVGSSTRITQAGLDKYITDHSGPIQRQRPLPKRKGRAGFNPDGEPFGI